MPQLVDKFARTLPARVGGVALATGALSTYWDIATHVDGGRERFLTPPHIGIYSSVGIALAAVALAVLADRRAAGASAWESLKHPFRGIRPGLAVAGAGMATAIAAAPFDNAWHEIYGIDVTIWSPPHLLAIFGISAAALGLTALVAPAATSRRSATPLFYVLLSGFLLALVITTGEFEFNGPQYRIAYHPIILSAATTLVFVTAAHVKERWAATTVALWFQAIRLAALLFLVALGHTLPFVPVVVPAAVIVDLLLSARTITPSRAAVAGVAASLVTVGTNWGLLEVLETIRWSGDDLVLGSAGAVLVAVPAAFVGRALGSRLAGTPADQRRRTQAAAAVATTVLLVMVPGAAVAHEVGGDAGSGAIRWNPGEAEVGSPVVITISDLEIRSRDPVERVDVQAWRAEHRIEVALERSHGRYRGTFQPTDVGPWMVFIRVRAGDRTLLSTQILDVHEHAPSDAALRERFTLGLDTIGAREPPAWVDAVAYGIAIAMLIALLTAVTRALQRLPRTVAEHVGG